MIRRTLLATMLAALALPGPAVAADTTSVVSGVVGSELSLGASPPAAMVLTHATPGATSAVVSVTSTQPSWTLQIKDASATSPGFMDRLLGSGPLALTNPLQWKLSSGSTWANLSATPATVTTGSLIGAPAVDFRQTLAATDTVATGDTYNLTVTYTVL